MVEPTDTATKLKKIEADFVELERLDRLKNRGELGYDDYDLWVAYYISVLRLFDVEYGYALQERRSMRLPVNVSASFTHQGNSFDATTVDLSVGGMAISHRDGIYVGQDVDLALSLGSSRNRFLSDSVPFRKHFWPHFLENVGENVYFLLKMCFIFFIVFQKIVKV